MKTYDELSADGWEHLTNIGNQEAADAAMVALRLVNDLYVYVTGEPKEAALTAQELSRRGIVGIYRRPGHAPPLTAYPVMFPPVSRPYVRPPKEHWLDDEPSPLRPFITCAG